MACDCSLLSELKPQDVQVQLAFVQELPSILLAASTVEKPRCVQLMFSALKNLLCILHYVDAKF